MDSPDSYYRPSADEQITYEPSRWTTDEKVVVKVASRSWFFSALMYFLALFILFCIWRAYSTYAAHWRQEQHMLNMRRRHGIPDDDKRPFEIAYRRAVHVRKERERAAAEASRAVDQQLPPSRSSSIQPIFIHRSQSQSQTQPEARRYGDEHSSTGSVRSRHHSTQSSQMIRTDSYSSLQPSLQPQPIPNVFRDTGSYAQVHVHRPSTPLSRTNSDDWAARYAPAGSAPAPAPTTHRKRHAQNGHVIPTIITTAPTPVAVARKSRKRLQLDSDDEGLPNGKRSRIEGRERIDGNQDATWFKSMPIVRKSVKRSASPGAEDPDSRPFPKRGKKSKPAELDTIDPMAASRGRKRPRNSTVAEDEKQSEAQRGIDKKKKGRMVSVDETPSTQEETLVSDSEEMDVNLNPDDSGPTTLDDDEILDYDLETSRSTDPLCGGRKIGEEWEINGREYKVGPDGKRLRNVTVKSAMRKYNMPKDSEHPDAKLQMDIIVDRWVTDEEYLNLKKLGQLGWQDSPVAAPPTDHKTIPFEGKPLIWGGAASRVPRRTASRLTPTGSPATSLSRLPSESFALSTTNSRRVGSPGAPMWMLIPGSRRKNGMYSDWEKQGLEAESILKMRQKLKASQAAAAAKAAAEAAPAPVVPTDETKKTVRFAETTTVHERTPSLLSWPSTTSNASMTTDTTPTPVTMEASKSGFSFNAPATATPAAPMTNFFNTPAATSNMNSMAPEPTPAASTPAIPNFFANTTATVKPTTEHKPSTSMFDFSKPASTTTPAATPGFSFNTVNAGTTPAVTDTNKPFTFGPSTSTTPATVPTSTNPFFNNVSSTPFNAMGTSNATQTPAAAPPTTNSFFAANSSAAPSQPPHPPKVPNFFSGPATAPAPAAQPSSVFSFNAPASSSPPTAVPNGIISRLGPNPTSDTLKVPTAFGWPQPAATNGAMDPTKPNPAVARPTASSFFSPVPTPSELPKPATTTRSPFFNGIDTNALVGKASTPATPTAAESKPTFTFGNPTTTPVSKGATFAFGTPSTTPAPALSTTPTTTPAAAKPAWDGPKFVFSSTPGAPETTIPASSTPSFQFNAGAAAGFPVKASAIATPAAPSTSGFQFNAGAAAGFPVKPAATAPASIFPANAAVPKFNMGAKPPATQTSSRYSSRPRSGFNSSAPPPPPANLTSPAPSALTPSAAPSASSTPANPFGAFGGAVNGATNGVASPFAFGAAVNPAATMGAFQFGAAASPNPAQTATAGSFFGAK